MKTSFSTIAAVLLLALASGCRVGSANFSSTVEGHGFEPNGTVFSYLDAHDAALVEDKDPRVVVAMTWLIFDPASDLNDLEGSALEEMKHEFVLRDALSLVFSGQKAVDPGADFSAVLRGDEIVDSDGMTAQIHFAPERLDSNATYADIQPLASKRTVEVNITAATFTEGSPQVTGTITIELEATAEDPGAALEGVISGDFTAPLVGERSAEHNLSLLDVKDVIGLPLEAP